MSAIAERVAAGAAFLDVNDPGWWRADVERAIDLDTLNLLEVDSCVLGQRCPLKAPAVSRYEAYGARLAGRDTRGIADLDSWAIPLGFQAVTGVIDDDGDPLLNKASLADYRALTAEWKRVIAERRQAGEAGNG
jgi:hypothetical protein